MLGVGVVVDLPDALDVDLISQLFPLDAVTDDRLDDCDLLVALQLGTRELAQVLNNSRWSWIDLLKNTLIFRGQFGISVINIWLHVNFNTSETGGVISYLFI